MKKNNGRRNKRKTSGEISPKKRAKKVSSPPPDYKPEEPRTEDTSFSSDSSQLTHSPDLGTPLRLTLSKDPNNDSYFVSSQAQQSSPTEATSPVIYQTSPRGPELITSMEGNQKSRGACNRDVSGDAESTSSAITDEEFKLQVLKSLGADAKFKSKVLNSLETLENQMTKFNQRIGNLEARTDDHEQSIGHLQRSRTNQNVEINNLKAEVADLRGQLAEKGSPGTNKIVIKNLLQEGWDQQKQSDEVNKVMKSIDPSAPDVKTVSEVGKNKVALVTLGKGHSVSEVMKKKSTLKDRKPYSRVFIEPQKSIAEQRAEANIRALTRATKGLEYRRGKVR